MKRCNVNIGTYRTHTRLQFRIETKHRFDPIKLQAEIGRRLATDARGTILEVEKDQGISPDLLHYVYTISTLNEPDLVEKFITAIGEIEKDVEEELKRQELLGLLEGGAYDAAML